MHVCELPLNENAMLLWTGWWEETYHSLLFQIRLLTDDWQMMSFQESEFGRFFRGVEHSRFDKNYWKNIIKYMTHIYIPKSSDVWVYTSLRINRSQQCIWISRDLLNRVCMKFEYITKVPLYRPSLAYCFVRLWIPFHGCMANKPRPNKNTIWIRKHTKICPQNCVLYNIMLTFSSSRPDDKTCGDTATPTWRGLPPQV